MNLKHIIIFLALLLLASSSDSPILAITRYPQLFVYEPKEKGRIVLFLHGGCGSPIKTCSLFAESVNSNGKWLICPGGTLKCERPGRMWNLKSAQTDIENSISFTKLMYDDKIFDGNRTVIGFSLGAIVAAKLIQENTNYSKAVMLGGFVKLDIGKLRGKEIILGAGRRDITYGYLKELDRDLRKHGIKSRFVEIGNIGHELPENIGEILKCQNIY